MKVSLHSKLVNYCKLQARFDWAWFNVSTNTV